MRIFSFLFFIGVIHLCLAQNSIERQIKKTQYTRSGASDLSREWDEESYIYYDNFDVTIVPETQSPEEYYDSLLAIKHEEYQKHLQKKLKEKQNVQKSHELPELPDLPKFEAPEFDEPDIDNPGTFPKWILRSILYIIIGAGLLVLFYFFLKNIRLNQVKGTRYDEHWNPEVVAISDLERRLQRSLKKENYREAIRVLFTMILKELIRLKQIKWARERTNIDYLNDIKLQKWKGAFSKCVYLFDVVWYGEYILDKTKYDALSITLTEFINDLKTDE